MDSEFFFALARISAAQILRAAGFVRCRSTTLDTFTDLLIGILRSIALTSIHTASAGYRSIVSFEDVIGAFEQVGVISAGKFIVHAGEVIDDVEPIEDFITWCKSDHTREIRRIAGMGNGMGEDFFPDWLSTQIQKEMKLSSEDRFKGTILQPASPVLSALRVLPGSDAINKEADHYALLIDHVREVEK